MEDYAAGHLSSQRNRVAFRAQFPAFECDLDPHCNERKVTVGGPLTYHPSLLLEITKIPVSSPGRHCIGHHCPFDSLLWLRTYSMGNTVFDENAELKGFEISK